MSNSDQIEIFFYFENTIPYYVSCSYQSTVGELLILIKEKEKGENYKCPSNFDEIHCVYLKGQTLDENDHLKDHLDDLQNNALFISDDPTKSYDYPFKDINIKLDDYENFECIKSTYYSNTLTAQEKTTNKKVLIDVFKDEDISSYLYMCGLSLELTLNFERTSKIIGFRYPLNSKEQINIKVYDQDNKLIYLRGLIIVYEYIPSDSFLININSEYLESKGQNHDKINPTIRSKIIYGVASIMKHLHENGVIHRYLTTGNVFLDELQEPKISGFDIAKRFESDLINTIRIGAPLYMSPEMLTINSKYGMPVDVFAYGVLLFLMFKGEKNVHKYMTFMMNVRRGKRLAKPDEIPEHYWDLIQRCWKQDPLDRPTFDEIVEILKDEKFALNEFGMRTNLDELHEYQDRIDSI